MSQLVTSVRLRWEFDAGTWRLYEDGVYAGFVQVTEAAQFKVRAADDKWISASQCSSHAHFDRFDDAKKALVKAHLNGRPSSACGRCKGTGWYSVPGGIQARCLCPSDYSSNHTSKETK